MINNLLPSINTGKNVLVAIAAEGYCHIFDFTQSQNQSPETLSSSHGVEHKPLFSFRHYIPINVAAAVMFVCLFV